MKQEFKAWLNLHKAEIYTWIFGLLFAFQIANTAGYLARNTYPQGVIASVDDDAAWIVKRAMATRWYKDNGTAVYGPAYFRLIHTVQYYLGDTAAPEGSRSAEAWQRTTHYTALLVSLFALAGTSLLLASLISRVWSSRFLIASVFLAAFLSHPVWVEFLFRAHPDHLFALVSLIAFILTYKMLAEPNRKLWFVSAAMVWGLTVAIKLTTALWAFGFVALFIPPFTKNNFMRALKFLGFMFLSYFLIGFPQTIVLGRPIRIMMELGALNQPATWATIQGWFETIGSQMWRPLIVLLLATVLFGESRTPRPNKTSWLRLIFFCLVPLPMLVTKNMVIPTTHYPIPFLILLFALIALIGINVPKVRNLSYLGRVLVMLSLLVFGLHTTPKVLNEKLAEQSKCRPEAFEAFGKVNELSKTYKFWFDPYFPGDSSDRKSPHKVEWRKTLKNYKDLQITALGLSTQYYHQYLAADAPNSWMKLEMPEWQEYREFYKPFETGNIAKMPGGDTLKKVYENSCGHEIWLLEPTKE